MDQKTRLEYSTPSGIATGVKAPNAQGPELNPQLKPTSTGAALLRSDTKAEAAPPHFTKAALSDLLPVLRGEAKSLASSVWSPPGGGGVRLCGALVASAYVRCGAKVN